MEQLTQISTLNLPINQETCFSTHKNKFSNRIMKEQSKILEKYAPLLKQFLEQGEEILRAVKACSPMSFLEQYTSGFVIYYIKRCVLIITNKRILHFPAHSDFSPKQSISQIRYGDVEKFKLSGLLGRTLQIEYKGGKKEKFYYVRSKEFKKLKRLLPPFVEVIQPFTEIMERHYLCPKCTKPLQKEIYVCPTCHLEFKNPARATKLSISLPGGGYFYTGHPILGLWDAMIEVILLITFILTVIEALQYPLKWSEAFVIAVILSIEKLVTIYHARLFVKEYLPANKNFAMPG